jgi:hypothetical protein
MLLLRQPNGSAPASGELDKIMARFAVWIQGMKDKDMVISTNGLETAGKVLRGKRGASVTDGPFAEAKEIIGGYVLIAADNLDQAVAAAQDCPGLDYAMAVEVRPINHQRKPNGAV